MTGGRRAGTSRGRTRDRIVELVRVRAGDLVSSPANWRNHPQRQRRALRALLAQVGYADALIARRVGEDLVLIDGHLRKDLDADQVVPVQVVDLDEHEAELLLATLDPLAGLATAEPEALARLLEALGPTSGAIGDLLDDVARSAGLSRRLLGKDPDAFPEAPPPRTSPGDLWLLGEHRLLCGDATEPSELTRLMEGARAQVLWTDPPYGVAYRGRTARALTIAHDRAEGLGSFLDRAFAAVTDVLDHGAPFYVCHPAGPAAAEFWRAIGAAGWRMRQGLVWVKDSMVLGHADYHYRHEPIAFGYVSGGGPRGRGRGGWFGGNDQDTVLEVPRPSASRQHPTMKPVELVRRCLENSSAPADAVIDQFAGSGTTLVACEALGRRAYLVELDPVYCDVIVARWEELTHTEARRVSGPEDGAGQPGGSG